MNPFTGTGDFTAHPHGANISLANGASFQIQALEETMFRVRCKPAGGYREPRTWAIAPLQGENKGQDVAWSGRNRDELAGFSCPNVLIDHHDGALTLKTSQLSVTLQPNTLALSWHAAHGEPIMNDRATSAYFSSARTGAVRHYLQREPGEKYYGLGDKTGPLDLHGRRLRTLAMDSLGYDPARGDPL